MTDRRHRPHDDESQHSDRPESAHGQNDPPEEDHKHRHGGLRGLLDDLLHPHHHDAAESIDPALEGSREGIHAVKVSLVALAATAALQLVVVVFSGSVALLSDTIHNFADASTALPLWVAFALGRRAPSLRYTYGYGRAEDVAGLFVLLMIGGSALLAAWESVDRLLEPRVVEHAWWVLGAGVLGAAGNEFVARYRMRAGRRIGSAALIADGVHARTDALTSLAVAAGAIAVLAGYPRADALVGILISAMILLVLKDTSLAIYRRMMDAVDPGLVARAEQAAIEVAGVRAVGRLRMRWVGHRLYADVDIAVDSQLDVASAQHIAEEVRRQIVQQVAGVEDVVVQAYTPVALGARNHVAGGQESHPA